jgi:hypothetical protein
MVALPYEYQQKALFHVSMTSESAYTAEDKGTAIAAMENLESEIIMNYFIDMIDELDDIWERLKGDSVQRFSYKEQVAGDINRSVVRDDPRSILREWKVIYDTRVSQMCQKFGLPDYNDVGSRWQYLRDAGSYVMAIPGPADTAISSRIREYQVDVAGGGFGVMVA